MKAGDGAPSRHPAERCLWPDQEVSPVRLKIVGMAFQNPTLLPWADDDRERHAAAGDRRAAIASRLRPRTQGLRGKGARAARHPSASPGSRTGTPGSSPAACRQRASLCRALIHDPQLPDAGRTVRRPRRLHAGGAVGRAAGALDAAEVHRGSGHPRPARGRLPGRHGACDERPAGPHRRLAGRRPAASPHARYDVRAGVRRYRAQPSRTTSPGSAPRPARRRRPLPPWRPAPLRREAADEPRPPPGSRDAVAGHDRDLRRLGTDGDRLRHAGICPAPADGGVAGLPGVPRPHHGPRAAHALHHRCRVCFCRGRRRCCWGRGRGRRSWCTTGSTPC